MAKTVELLTLEHARKAGMPIAWTTCALLSAAHLYPWWAQTTTIDDYIVVGVSAAFAPTILSFIGVFASVAANYLAGDTLGESFTAREFFTWMLLGTVLWIGVARLTAEDLERCLLQTEAAERVTDASLSRALRACQ